MDASQPLISIIVPCYNQAQYLDECLQSVLNQTYEKWECIIVNDGSPDNTEEVAKIWIDNDTRFKYVAQDNSGVSAARNFGISHAKGDWILPIDGDDYISKDYLKQASEYFINPTLRIITGKVKKFDAEKELWELPSYSPSALAEGNMIHNTSFFRKEDWAKSGGYDTNLLHGYEDWDFWISMLKEGGDVQLIDQICLYYRIRNVSRSVKLLNGKLEGTHKYIEKKHFDFFAQHLKSWHYYLFYAEARKIELNIIKRNLLGKAFAKFQFYLRRFI